MSKEVIALLVVVGSFLTGLGLTRWLIGYMAARQVVDTPGARTSHDVATPRGGGIAIILPVILCWLGFALFDVMPVASLWGLAGMVVLALVSFRDDLGHVPAGIRLACQLAAVLLGLVSFGGQPILFAGALPVPLEYGLVILGWLWFINLFNFMDGIDGLTGAQTLAICLGLFVLGGAETSTLVLPLMAATVGFLWWNWPRAKQPARIFMGDVGSVPLGFVLAYMLLGLAAWRNTPTSDLNWPVVVILPLYYWMDATLTLLRRLLRGQKPWQAHRDHFYQLAANGKLSHRQVVQFVSFVNAILIGMGVFALSVFDWPWPMGISAVSVAALLLYFYGQRQKT